MSDIDKDKPAIEEFANMLALQELIRAKDKVMSDGAEGDTRS